MRLERYYAAKTQDALFSPPWANSNPDFQGLGQKHCRIPSQIYANFACCYCYFCHRFCHRLSPPWSGLLLFLRHRLFNNLVPVHPWYVQRRASIVVSRAHRCQSYSLWNTFWFVNPATPSHSPCLVTSNLGIISTTSFGNTCTACSNMMRHHLDQLATEANSKDILGCDAQPQPSWNTNPRWSSKMPSHSIWIGDSWPLPQSVCCQLCLPSIAYSVLHYPCKEWVNLPSGIFILQLHGPLFAPF
jgi:hypothetical protein